MKRRWQILIGLTLVLLIRASLLHPAVHWRLIGWAKGDDFYAGRPTSYWASRIDRCLRTGLHGEQSLFDRLSGYQPIEDAKALTRLLFQPEALSVVLGLLRDERFEIRRAVVSVLIGMDPPPQAAAGPLREYLHSGHTDEVLPELVAPCFNVSRLPGTASSSNLLATHAQFGSHEMPAGADEPASEAEAVTWVPTRSPPRRTKNPRNCRRATSWGFALAVFVVTTFVRSACRQARLRAGDGRADRLADRVKRLVSVGAQNLNRGQADHDDQGQHHGVLDRRRAILGPDELN
jgi:hypothetical protein